MADFFSQQTTFFEQIIKRKNTIQVMLLKCLILFVGLLLFFAMLPLCFLSIGGVGLGPFAFLIAVGALYFAWYLISGLNLEFEYIFTDGELDIDKISAKRKRKRMLSVRVSSFEEFDAFDLEKYRQKQYDVVYNASASLQEPGNYYAVFRNAERKQCILILTPNEKILEAIQKAARWKVHGR